MSCTAGDARRRPVFGSTYHHVLSYEKLSNFIIPTTANSTLDFQIIFKGLHPHMHRHVSFLVARYGQRGVCSTPRYQWSIHCSLPPGTRVDSSGCCLQWLTAPPSSAGRRAVAGARRPSKYIKDSPEGCLGFGRTSGGTHLAAHYFAYCPPTAYPLCVQSPCALEPPLCTPESPSFLQL